VIRYWSSFNGEFMISVMSWLVKKVRTTSGISILTLTISQGDHLKDDSPISMPYLCYQEVEDGRFKTQERQIYIYDGINAEKPPMYQDQGMYSPCCNFSTTDEVLTGPRRHAILKADLSRIPERRLKRAIGEDGEDYYKLDHDVKAAFHSAHTEYSLWYQNECFGKVEVAYD
jgi:hypothetical protein